VVQALTLPGPDPSSYEETKGNTGREHGKPSAMNLEELTL